MDVNEHEELSNLILRHKLKKRGDFSAILHFTVAVNFSVMNKTHSLKLE